MSTSGIITRGYANTSSTVITRGYGQFFVATVEEAVLTVVPHARIVNRGRSQYSRRSVDYNTRYRPPKQQQSTVEEVTVTVELSGRYGDELSSTIMGEVGRKFDAVGINVDVTSVDVAMKGASTYVEVTLIRTDSIMSAPLHVTASLKHT